MTLCLLTINVDLAYMLQKALKAQTLLWPRYIISRPTSLKFYSVGNASYKVDNTVVYRS